MYLLPFFQRRKAITITIITNNTARTGLTDIPIARPISAEKEEYKLIRTQCILIKDLIFCKQFVIQVAPEM